MQPVTTAGLEAPAKAPSGRRALYLQLATALRSAKSDDEAAETLEAAIEALGEVTE